MKNVSWRTCPTNAGRTSTYAVPDVRSEMYRAELESVVSVAPDVQYIHASVCTDRSTVLTRISAVDCDWETVIATKYHCPTDSDVCEYVQTFGLEEVDTANESLPSA